jgi:hypothetical protein
MPIQLSVENIEKDLEEMEMNLHQIDMESVKEKTLKRVADEMASTVRQAVFESSIKSPASKISEYDSGEGPPMATNDAWIVKKDGENRYTVVPHPDVRQRAIVLNFGYPGKITADDGYMEFNVNGTPMYRKEVEGPEAVGYWQAAFQKLQNSNKLQEIGEEELEIEFEEKF